MEKRAVSQHVLPIAQKQFNNLCSLPITDWRDRRPPVASLRLSEFGQIEEGARQRGGRENGLKLVLANQQRKNPRLQTDKKNIKKRDTFEGISQKHIFYISSIFLLSYSSK